MPSEFNYRTVVNAVDSILNFTSPELFKFKGEVRLQFEDKKSVRARANDFEATHPYIRCQNEACRQFIDLMEEEKNSGNLTSRLHFDPSDLPPQALSEHAVIKAYDVVERALIARMTRVGKYLQ